MTPSNLPKPHWSARSLFFGACVLTLAAVVTAIVIGNQPLWIELEVAVVLLGCCLFCFYAWLLFHGIEVSNEETLELQFMAFPKTISDVPDVSGIDGVFEIAGGLAELGPIGVILAIPFALLGIVAAAIVLAILISVLIWVGVNGFVLAVFVFVTPLFWFFKQSVQYVLRHSAQCRGKIFEACKWAGVYASFKAASLYAVIYLAHLLLPYL